ncbi:hypothetical protein [Pedobacter helvus]|uniref:Uncharacterized protein n=1 Tax=Pedobacter helvus TaxID=2563444 RepID=A0ABW9JHX9_9SPHI|nr:hypothetical protein [Pedobacter ureilyticus]
MKPYFTFDAIMRAAAIFCFSLFFLLFKGNESAHAIVSRISQGYEFFSENPHTKQHHTPFHKNANIHIQKNSSTRELNYIEETQDDEESIVRKGIIALKQSVYFCYALLVGSLQIIRKLALPYCEHLSFTASFKYILLRVFRI